MGSNNLSDIRSSVESAALKHNHNMEVDEVVDLADFEAELQKLKNLDEK